MKNRDACRPLSLAVATFLAAVPVAAQVPVTQTVVVTAAATPIELGSVTRSLRVITREEIAQLPVHSVADVLRVVRALEIHATTGTRPSELRAAHAFRSARHAARIHFLDPPREELEQRLASRTG